MEIDEETLRNWYRSLLEAEIDLVEEREVSAYERVNDVSDGIESRIGNSLEDRL